MSGEPESVEPPAPPSWLETLIVRVLNIPVQIACRLADLAVLLLRPRLLPTYFRLWARELIVQPYRWPRSFEAIRVLKESGQTVQELVYGELPVATALYLFWRAGLRQGGQLLDLGAGRGRPLLAARWLGAEARGIELLPAHVLLAAPVLARAEAELVLGDARTAPLGSPTHVFLNWCGLRGPTREAIEKRLIAELPVGTRILTVRIPLAGSTSAAVRQVRTLRGLFTWGMERVYAYERVSSVPRKDGRHA